MGIAAWFYDLEMDDSQCALSVIRGIGGSDISRMIIIVEMCLNAAENSWEDAASKVLPDSSKEL